VRPIADKLYCEIIPYIVSIERFDKPQKHILDREFAIDVELKLQSPQISSMKITLQEKFRSYSAIKYDDVTVEHYNDPILKIKGDWFYLAAQLYFTGYVSADETKFEKWILLDWVRVVLESYKGNIHWRIGQNRYTKASFVYTKMSSFPDVCVIASKI
jgi:hypothetical protein